MDRFPVRAYPLNVRIPEEMTPNIYYRILKAQGKNALGGGEVYGSAHDEVLPRRPNSIMERHLQSADYRQLLLVLEMATKQPEIRFDTILSSMGIETIEKARSSTR